mmetsp:Transcript_71996/g.191032  ORF Transcript_71996/g.191032 Transcript_71996/m.191032 type:complete len:177 (+) Transcript_71996:2-532(+)
MEGVRADAARAAEAARAEAERQAKLLELEAAALEEAESLAKAEAARLADQARRQAAEEEVWVADNSELRATASYVAFRLSQNIDDKINDGIRWGDTVEGTLTWDEQWVQVRSGHYFLPVRVGGVPVLRPRGGQAQAEAAPGARAAQGAEDASAAAAAKIAGEARPPGFRGHRSGHS